MRAQLISHLICSSLVTASHAASIHKAISHQSFHLSQRGVAPPSNLPSNWSYKGCYLDVVSSRSLGGSAYTDNSAMTAESCIAFCSSHGYNLAGTEYSVECYCGSYIGNSATVEPGTDCNMPCSGDSTEACGGPNRLTVFSNGQAQVNPVVNPGPDGWSSNGCVSDSVNSRSLSNKMTVAAGDSGMTVSQCTTACYARNFYYAGVEYGDECYCSNTLIYNGPAPPCNMVCAGNSSEFCGGANSLNLYARQPVSSKPLPTGWYGYGCHIDTVSARVLRSNQPVLGGASNMTVENCLAACSSAGYQLAGVEYGSECWCGNTQYDGASDAAPNSNSGCNMHCTGDSTEICGGSNRLNMYQYIAPSASSPTSPNLVNDGSFENPTGDAGYPWKWRITQGSFSTSFLLNNQSIDGRGEASVQSVTQTGNRYIYLESNFTGAIADNTYSFIMYVGRATTSLQAQNTQVKVNIGGVDILTASLCGGGNQAACPIKGNGGSAYQMLTGTWDAPADYGLISIQFYFYDNAQNTPVLIDGVSLRSN